MSQAFRTSRTPSKHAPRDHEKDRREQRHQRLKRNRLRERYEMQDNEVALYR